jgi:membrane-bound lytic murein transglycosylase F
MSRAPLLSRLFWLLPLLILAGCEQPPQVARIQARGELLVATRHAPTTFYRGSHGPMGMEYELLKGLADTLGVHLRLVFPDTPETLLRQVREGRVHLAANGLPPDPRWARGLRLGEPYQRVETWLLYRRGSRRPHAIGDIHPGELQIPAGAGFGALLRRLRTTHPGLTWITRHGVRLRDLLAGVNAGQVRYTLITDNELEMARQVFPYLRKAIRLDGPRPLRWLFPVVADDSLRTAANAYLERIRASGHLRELLDRYYGHDRRLDFVGRRDFQRHILSRLPALKPYFIMAARQTGIDWRLLAAIGYQESHWDPKAVSPTGVRGVMMLTSATARQLGVEDRRDPKQSILGGARYLRIVEEKIPKRIQEPDRLWLTLAGYNIGFGHLEDARVLTQRQGGNPDRWADVRQRLPLLNRGKFQKELKYGRANGAQAVEYVENIRAYQTLLMWYDQHPEDLQAAPAAQSSPSQSAR